MDALDLCNLFYGFGLTQFVFENTRGGSCLDNAFSNIGDNALSVEVLDEQTCLLSDHLALVCSLQLDTGKTKLPTARVNYRPVTDIGLFNLYNRVDNTDWGFITSPSMHPEQKFDRFIDTLRYHIEASFPLKSKLLHRSSKKIIHWFGSELREMRDRLYLLRLMHRDFPHLVSVDDIKRYRRRYRTKIIHCRRAATDSFIVNSKNPQLAMWDVIKSSNPVNSPPKSSLITEDFFVGMAENIIGGLPPSAIDPLTFLANPPTQNFRFREVSYIEMSDSICHLKNSKSMDSYGMSVKMLKTLRNLLVVPLTKLINLCIVNAIFPRVLKVAKVIPIHKKDSVDEASNYRPISVVPVFAKIFEMLINGQISAYFEQNSLYNNAQFGFRRGLSTTHAIADCHSW